MAFYRICPDCGAYLDPGEQCSCHEEHLIEMERKEKGVFEVTVIVTFPAFNGVIVPFSSTVAIEVSLDS